MLLAALATVAMLGLWVLTVGPATREGGIGILAAYLTGGGIAGGGAFFLTACLLRVQEPVIAWQRALHWWKNRHMLPTRP